jgi:acyl-[acyl-carrier-protein]-phospholipid O-acyltransferase / long-chain-fatty-acid--[acyl-carrier-protein] ligase
LPPLFLPRADQFIAVSTLPMLGTGKVDLRAIKDLCGSVARTSPTPD